MLAAFAWVIHDQFEQRVVDVGDTAPNFSVTTETGRRISRSEFGGKLLVLNFWATWCPPCVEEMPSLSSFAREMSKEGVVVLGVSIDRDQSAYKQFLQRSRVAFETVRDEQANIPTDYGTFKWPETYIIDQKGRVVQKLIGPKDWTDPQLVNSIRALL